MQEEPIGSELIYFGAEVRGAYCAAAWGRLARHACLALSSYSDWTMQLHTVISCQQRPKVFFFMQGDINWQSFCIWRLIMKTTFVPASLTAEEMAITRSECQASEKHLAHFPIKPFIAFRADVQTDFPSQVSKCQRDAEHG